MPRLSLKPDASFYKKIAVGAVGARAVARDLDQRSHRMRELENGATDTKLWKDVKRKRVRIPDLICSNCGLRVESRAKTGRDLSMSHSPSDAERAWDYGMVDSDVIAFPVVVPVEADHWSIGSLDSGQSYWHERERITWESRPYVNYFTVGAFRAARHSRQRTKGATEGSETSVTWDAVISTRTGVVQRVDESGLGAISIQRERDGHLYTWRAKSMPIRVDQGARVFQNQVLASNVDPVRQDDLVCKGSLDRDHIARLLTSPERSQRFSGAKLARLRSDVRYRKEIQRLAEHPDEDLYVKLEGSAYLASVCGASTLEVFEPYLFSRDDQTRLEAVVAISEASTVDSVQLLATILDDFDSPYYLRSAAAWGLGRIGSSAAHTRLIEAFANVEQQVREDALEAVAGATPHATPLLIEAIIDGSNDIAAGAAEAIRRQGAIGEGGLLRLLAAASKQSPWPVWLLGQLPRNEVSAAAIATLQEESPEAHFAVAVLWAFRESWIARRWELHTRPSVKE